jgi:hypothetical protein
LKCQLCEKSMRCNNHKHQADGSIRRYYTCPANEKHGKYTIVTIERVCRAIEKPKNTTCSIKMKPT